MSHRVGAKKESGNGSVQSVEREPIASFSASLKRNDRGVAFRVKATRQVTPEPGVQGRQWHPALRHLFSFLF